MAVLAQFMDREISRRVVSMDASALAFWGVCALLFAASAAATIMWGTSMSGHGGMPMPGGWMMSMMWMRMPGQSWPGFAASFLSMWIVMMVAMMLPSLVPSLWRYREAGANTGAAHAGRLTALVGVGYFLMWTVVGMAVFALGVALAELVMQHPALARAVRIATAMAVLLAGAFQFSPRKLRYLACCRAAAGEALRAGGATACGHGLRLGLHCSRACGNLMAILLVIGVMDLRVMAVVTAAITFERVVPVSGRVTRAIGTIFIAAGLLLCARATALG